MDTRMEMHELVAFNAAVSQGLDRRVDRINQASKDLKKFTGRHSGIDGKAAQAISAYISDVHLGGIMTMINEIIERFNQLNTMYIGHYPHVDEGSNDFFLLSKDYEEINSNAKKMRTKFSDDEEKLIAITNEVDDIVSSFSTNDAMTEFDKIDENFADINKNIHRQSRDWSSYESQCARRYAELDAAIHVVKRLIEEYANKSVADLGSYQEGLFARDLTQKDMQVFDKLSNKIDRDKNFTKIAEKNLKALNRKYAQIEAEKERLRQRELNKRDGRNSFIVDGLFALAGIAVTACTAGVGVPLVLAIGSNILLPLLDLSEDLDKATTGKEYGANFIKDFLHGYLKLDRPTTEKVYAVASLGIGVAGSKGAFEAAKDSGYLVSRGIKAEPLFKSLKAVGTEAVSIENVSNIVRKAKDVKYLKTSAKSLAEKTEAAFFMDRINFTDAIKGNIKLGWENKFLKEGFIPHFNNKVAWKDIGKICKIYGKETLKQGEKMILKDCVVSPLITMGLNAFPGSDKNSVPYKAAKKFLNKNLTKPLQKKTDEGWSAAYENYKYHQEWDLDR